MPPSLQSQLLDLKQQKGALIIAHYYQDAAIQDIADYVGDSLGMALFAKEKDYKMAVVCGVRFMAETFKVMNPQKKILIPDADASCSLADMCTPPVFQYFKDKHPGAYVVTYINSSLAIKAMSDVIVTSANAVKIVNAIPKDRPVIFAPDQHLGRYVAKQTGRDLHLFPGNCFVHTSFSAKALTALQQQHPEAVLIAHPECEEWVLARTSFVGSTGQMLAFTKESPHQSFIVLTEAGILHQMQKASPSKTFLMGPDLSGCACNLCPHMRLNTMEKVYACLKNELPEIIVDESLAAKARVPIDRMMKGTA